MPLSDRMKELMLQQHSDLCLVKLITIEHPDLEEPIRVCDYDSDFEAESRNFISMQFKVSLADEKDDESPKMQIEISNVTGEVLEHLRPLTTRPTVTLEVVYDKFPDDIELTCPEFELSDVTWDAITVSGVLSVEDFINEPFCYKTFNKTEYPGIVP